MGHKNEVIDYQFLFLLSNKKYFFKSYVLKSKMSFGDFNKLFLNVTIFF